MSDHHHHSHDHSGPLAIGATAARVVVGLLAVIGVLVVAGLVWLWPSAQQVDIPLPMQSAGGGAVTTEGGTVVMQDIGACGSPSIGRVFADEPLPPRNNSYTCERSIITIDSGPHEGNKTLFEIAKGPGQPQLHVGDSLRIVRQTDASGAPMYSFDDYARGLPLTIIVIIFAVVIIAVARWRGLRALIGLVFAFGVVVKFLLPALLDGKPAIPVALVSGALILYAVLYLAHGVNLRTSSALLGTLASMVLAAVLSWVALEMTHLTGLSEEQNTNVATYLQHVSITGLLLAGFIIGSLGVLNDVTITQASAAFELAALDEKATRRSIFGSAMRVGRDHIASTVYTLVLAYAGGALPLLLLFSVAGRSIKDVLTGDAVGIEIARSAVGGIALALSVPLTTAIAVMLARPFGRKPAPVRSGAVARRTAGARAGAGTKRPLAEGGTGATGGTRRPRATGAGAPSTGASLRKDRPGAGSPPSDAPQANPPYAGPGPNPEQPPAPWSLRANSAAGSPEDVTDPRHPITGGYPRPLPPNPIQPRPAGGAPSDFDPWNSAPGPGAGERPDRGAGWGPGSDAAQPNTPTDPDDPPRPRGGRHSRP